MASVTFSASVGGDNSTVSDDSNPTTGLANGGHRTRFVPALAQLVAVASYVVSQASVAGASASAASGSASTASAAAGTATTQAAAAAASAVAAANSAAATQPSNVNGTSTDSITIATANGQSKALTYAEAGRAIVNGMFLVFAAAASPSVNWMLIQVTGWNSGTRVVTGDVVAYQGSGTYASWVISGPSGPQGPAGEDADLLMPWTARSGAVTLVEGDKGGASKLTSATVTFDTPAALGNGWTHVVEGTSGTSTLTASFADGTSSKTLTQGRTAYLACDGTAIRYVPFGVNSQAFGTLGTKYVAASVASGVNAICNLSATRSFRVRCDASQYLIVDLVDQNGQVLGSTGPVQAVAVSLQPCIVPLTATTAIMSWQTASPAKTLAVQVEYTGSTPSCGTVFEVESFFGGPTAIMRFSATKVAVIYPYDAGGTRYRVLTPGSTITAVAAAGGLTSAGNTILLRAAAMSATQGVLIGQNGANASSLYAVTESAGVLTRADWSGLGGSSATAADIIYTGANSRFLCVHGYGNNLGYAGVAYTLDMSGTGTNAVLRMGPLTLIPPTNGTNGWSLAQVGANTFTATGLGPYGFNADARALQLDGQRVTEVAVASFNTGAASNGLGTCVSGTNLLLAYADPTNSNYPTTVALPLGTVGLA